MRRLGTIVACTILTGVAAAPAGAQSFPEPLANEPIPSVATLPDHYPASWVLVHDFNMNSIVDGRVAIADIGSPERALKGFVRATQFASYLYSSAKNEIYTAETFYTRFDRGERTDAITIWDGASLQPKGEIILPGGKRQASLGYKSIFQFTNHQRWALLSNFTPAQSVRVIDLENRAVLNEIDLPGCAHIYPTGERGFATLCADGSMTSIALDEKGQVASSKVLNKIYDIDKQPMFNTPVMVGTTAWFVSFYGQLKPFDMSGPVAKPIAGSWSLGTAEGGTPEWRPSGWQVIASDASGLLYVLMTPNGKEGTHKDGGTEVWVYDPVKKARVRRIALKGAAMAVDVTREATPHVVVAGANGVIDVFDAATGAFVRSLGTTVAQMPMSLTIVTP